VAVDLQQELGRLDGIAIAGVPFELYRRVEEPECFIDPRRAAEHRILAGDHAATHLLAGRHEKGGDVARADVFTQRGGDLRADIERACVGKAVSV
jgi:hypothetical protein